MSADFGRSRKAGFGQDSDHRHKRLGNERARAFAAAVAEITTTAGRPIRYTQIVPDAFADGLCQAGVPQDVIALLGELFPVVLDGRKSHVMHGVEEVLGRSARDFSDYARATAASGAWGL
jgi:hypothetical protein